MDTPDHRSGPKRTRSAQGRYIRTPDSAERDADACRLRNLAMPYDEIAAQMGYADRSAARKAVERAMLLTVQEPAAAQRTLQLGRLDLLFREAWAVLKAEHIAINNGRVIMNPANSNEPLRDHAPVLAAIDRLLKIEERRAKLLGLDAPVRAELITIDAIEAEVARLAAELDLTPPVHR